MENGDVAVRIERMWTAWTEDVMPNWRIFTVVVLVLVTLGCTSVRRDEGPATTKSGAGESDLWITVANKDGDDTFAVDPNYRIVQIPKRVQLENELAWRGRLPSDGVKLLGEDHVGSRQLLIAQYDFGSGLTNTFICIYEMNVHLARLRYVWSRPFGSTYGFNECVIADQTLRVIGNHPAQHGSKAEYTEVSLPMPEGVLPKTR